MYGFYNKLLRVNLTNQTFQVEPIQDDVLRKNLGGKGLATHLLLDNLPQGTDPLAPENVLIFITGPAGGTGLPPASRYGVFTKSPQTGGYLESYSGGTLAPYIKSAGYDAVLLEGAGQKPVYLHITPEGVTFHDAAHIWGKDAYATEDMIREEVDGKAEVVVIGPAGENLVAFAGISNNYWRCAGRGGAGAVMGSKKVKGIAFSGDREAAVGDPDLLKEYMKSLREKGKDNPGVNAYRNLGTPMMVKIMNDAQAFPTRYWHEGRFSGQEKINADYMQKNFQVKNQGCTRCFMACGKLSTILEGPRAGLTVEGPEYETIYAFGGLCLIDSLEDILYLNDICDRLGIDTISAGNLAAFAIEAGLLGKFDGAPAYGDVAGIVDLLYKISAREGEGAVLADGIKTAARKLGLEDLAIHVKGMEPAGYDPRTLNGMGLAYATSDRGACHLRATFYKPELSGMIDPKTTEGKAELFTDFEDRATLFDSLIFCRFYRDLVIWDDLAVVIKALTGLDLSKDELRTTANYIATNTRRFNVREGITAKDDSLPPRFMSEPIGENKEHVMTEEKLKIMLTDYYRLRGWDELGVPKD